jgi:hypothetical protein
MKSRRILAGMVACLDDKGLPSSLHPRAEQ